MSNLQWKRTADSLPTDESKRCIVCDDTTAQWHSTAPTKYLHNWKYWCEQPEIAPPEGPKSKLTLDLEERISHIKAGSQFIDSEYWQGKVTAYLSVLSKAKSGDYSE